jgi:hypothetical protein
LQRLGLDRLTALSEVAHDALGANELLQRLGPLTDDLDRWSQLPDEITVYRAGAEGGVSWSTDREDFERFAKQHELSPIRVGRVTKQDVLAFITSYGESEIVALPADVKTRQMGGKAADEGR